MSRFADRVVLVTGAASGLGLATARLFASEGASLVLVDIDGAKLEKAKVEIEELGAHVVTHTGDVSKPITARSAVELTEATFGKLDVLFNNAAICPLTATALIETSDEMWDQVIDINVKSVFLFCKAAIPLLIKTGGGSIVTTASTAGLKASPRESVYGISKAALIQMTKSLARDHAKDKIRANCICPGFLEAVMTDRRAEMTSDALVKRRARASELVPLGREGGYEEVARSVAFLASELESSYITGAAVVIDGGFTVV
ncbi:SDR family NAD(P)-dependent oxidoreductase [Pseudomonas azerbaijanoccidentalis]|jgi:NAD(P)-dependent dehydrogenase (short-subunit alcohol dehydrogenase family)